MREFQIKNKKNLLLNVISPEYSSNIPYNGLVIHLHGICSHFQKFINYPNIIDSLQSRNNYFSNLNLKSYALEFHGHGKSEGLRCCIYDFDDLLEDLNCLLIYLEKNHSNFNKMKIFLIAESMGGAVAIKYAINYPDKVDGLILLSPMCGIDESLKPGYLKTQFLLYSSYLFPENQWITTANDISEKGVMRDIYREIYENDTNYYKENHRLTTARECLEASEWLSENGHKITTPFILVHGLADKVTIPHKSIDFYNEASTSTENKSILLFPDAYHGILTQRYDDDKLPETILNKIMNWLGKQLLVK